MLCQCGLKPLSNKTFNKRNVLIKIKCKLTIIENNLFLIVHFRVISVMHNSKISLHLIDKVVYRFQLTHIGRESITHSHSVIVLSELWKILQ